MELNIDSIFKDGEGLTTYVYKNVSQIRERSEMLQESVMLSKILEAIHIASKNQAVEILQGVDTANKIQTEEIMNGVKTLHDDQSVMIEQNVKVVLGIIATYIFFCISLQIIYFFSLGIHALMSLVLHFKSTSLSD